MYTIAQLKRKLRLQGYGKFSDWAIAETLKQFNALHKVVNRRGYYRGSNLFDILTQHLDVLRRKEESYKYITQPSTPTPPTDPKPQYINRNKGISRASQELLDLDDVSYDGIIKEAIDNVLNMRGQLPFDELEDTQSPMIGTARASRQQARIDKRMNDLKQAYEKLMNDDKRVENDTKQLYGADNYIIAKEIVDRTFKQYIDVIQKSVLPIINFQKVNADLTFEYIKQLGIQIEQAYRNLEQIADNFRPDWSVDEENDENYELLSKANALQNLASDKHIKFSNLMERLYELVATKLK